MAGIAIWKAATFGCVLHGHNFTLDSPAAIDGSGCKRVYVEDSYIEIDYDSNSAYFMGPSWALRYQTADGSVPPITIRFNVLAALHSDRTPFPGFSRQCSDGYFVKVRHDEDNNLHMSCIDRAGGKK